MKLKTLIKAGSLALSATTILLAQEVKLNIPSPDKPAAAAPAAAPAKTPAAAQSTQKYSDEMLAETFGWFMMARLGLSELKLSPSEVEAFSHGVALAAAGNDSPYNLAEIGPAMNEFITARQQAATQREKQRNMAEAVEFFKMLKGRPGVVALPNGLCYEILKQGTGPNPTKSDEVKINYVGMLLNGQVFDSSEQHGGPLVIALSDTIPGWSEGVQLINKGGKIKLYIPPELAYGDDPVGAIPNSAALIFEIELLDFQPAPSPSAETSPVSK